MYNGYNQKQRKYQVLVGMWGNWSPYTLLMGMTYGVATLENILVVSYVHTQMAALFFIVLNWKKTKMFN